MSIAPHYISPLLGAAHAFFDAPDRDSLLGAIELHTASILGVISAQVVIPESRSTVSQDLAAQFGLTEEIDEDGNDDLRHRLEPFYSVNRAVSSDEDGELGAAVRDLFGDRSALTVALRAGSYFYGVAAALDEPGARVFNADDRAVLEEMAAFAGQALRFEEIARDREARDGLTGLFDQAYLRRELKSELERHRGPLTVVMFDIDHFKRINDTAGHAAGDDVLRLVSAFVRQETRAADVAVRYGGEEFAIMLVGAGEDAGYGFGERLRQCIAGQQEGNWGSWPGPVTISVGVASTETVDPGDGAALVEAADAALYRAKRGGRNLVCRASDNLPE